MLGDAREFRFYWINAWRFYNPTMLNNVVDNAGFPGGSGKPLSAEPNCRVQSYRGLPYIRVSSVMQQRLYFECANSDDTSSDISFVKLAPRRLVLLDFNTWLAVGRCHVPSARLSDSLSRKIYAPVSHCGLLVVASR